MVEVRTDADGVPGAVLHKQQWLPVIEVLDRYRTDDRWWTSEPVTRTYYELQVEDGRVVTVFRDLIGARWYEQRYS